jgi:hypothetical protein
MPRPDALPRPHAQRGAALLIMMAIVVVGASWLVASQLNSMTAGFSASQRSHNAAVLNKAKQALIGYVAMTAATAGEKNPGRLPCPEHPWYIGNSSKEGVMGPSVGVSNPGVGAPSSDCTMVGRLPWRSLGLDKLVDAAGEPLWYVVSPGVWSLKNSSSSLTINSNKSGELSVDNVDNAAVALIIAPGPAMNVQASAGCTARNQTRSVPSPSINALDYIECFNTDPATFATTGASTSFNDQVVQITTADLLPAIEAAIAQRIGREIAPRLKAVYGSSTWGSKPVFPYPAPFSDPATSNYQGAAGTYEGLLPFNYSAGCTPAADPRCTTTLIAWSSPLDASVEKVSGEGDLAPKPTCIFLAGATRVRCSGSYNSPSASIELRMKVRATNFARALRALDASTISAQYHFADWNTVSAAESGQINSDGSATIMASASFPAGSTIDFRIEMDIAMVADHPLLDAGTSSSTGWFVRNEWYRLTYYAVAQGHSAAGMPGPSCTPPDCLSVTNVAPAGEQRAILILGGRSLNGAVRPSGSLADYLEFGNAGGAGAFERQPVSTVLDAALKKPFNDRIIVVDENP